MYVDSNGEIGNPFCDGPITRRVRQPWCRVRVQTVNDEPSMVQDSHADQTDVNAIVERFARTGYLPATDRQPQYGDVTGLQGDFTDLINRSQEQIRQAEEFKANWKPPEPTATPTPPVEPPQSPPTA